TGAGRTAPGAAAPVVGGADREVGAAGRPCWPTGTAGPTVTRPTRPPPPRRHPPRRPPARPDPRQYRNMLRPTVDSTSPAQHVARMDSRGGRLERRSGERGGNSARMVSGEDGAGGRRRAEDRRRGPGVS